MTGPGSPVPVPAPVPAAVPRETKDWTWVLTRPCEECGLDASALDVTAVPRMLRENADAWVRLLALRADVAVRPSPQVWSPLEYACHVRDVFGRFAVRLQLMLTEDDPLFANWDQDATAVEEGYAQQDPAAVAVELEAAAEVAAAGFAAVSGDEWRRTGRRSDGRAFTVETLARYFVHDPVHHLHDVRPT